MVRTRVHTTPLIAFRAHVRFRSVVEHTGEPGEWHR